jgi:hypothetical protein
VSSRSLAGDLSGFSLLGRTPLFLLFWQVP